MRDLEREELLHELRSLRPRFERFLEVVSEASRHIPDTLKDTHGFGIPWRNIAGLGNILRHAYPTTDLGILWDIAHRD